MDLSHVKISTFRNTFDNKPDNHNVSITKVFELIKSETMRQRIADVYHGTLDKRLLPAFTPSCAFDAGETRKDSAISNYSQIICLDFDDLPNVREFKALVIKNRYVMAAFISPSYKGLKVFCKVDCFADNHLLCWSQLAEYFETLFHHPVDAKCKNITRLCYYSYDPYLYLNTDSVLFPFQKLEGITVPACPQVDRVLARPNSAEWLIELTKNKAGEYCSGNRNEFIFRLACNCNRYGLSSDDADSVCWNVFKRDNKDFSQKEYDACIKSAYKNTAEHGKFKLL
jgi:VirE N-terminal domain/Primase C terminal 1 (PriCT-1)